MTEAQWLFEYHALRLRERDRAEDLQAIFDASRKTLSTMLGLNIAGDGDDAPMVPLALMCGNPELLAKAVEFAEQHVASDAVLEDDDFEAWSAAMAQGDMVPFSEPLEMTAEQRANPYMHSDEYQRVLKAMVKPKGSVIISSG